MVEEEEKVQGLRLDPRGIGTGVGAPGGGRDSSPFGSGGDAKKRWGGNLLKPVWYLPTHQVLATVPHGPICW